MMIPVTSGPVSNSPRVAVCKLTPDLVDSALQNAPTIRILQYDAGAERLQELETLCPRGGAVVGGNEGHDLKHNECNPMSR
jgi:hypothetical protein